LSASCARVRTMHLEASGVPLRQRLNRDLGHILITSINIVTKRTSHTNIALLLLLRSYLDIGHVILNVLHVVSCVLIRLVGDHQVVQEVLLYHLLGSLVWSGLAGLAMDVFNYLDVALFGAQWLFGTLRR
jgi:hypothetical protein